MKRHLVILAMAAGTGLVASSAQAHHSHPYFYDQCKSITVEGRVEDVQWKDPHTLIVLKRDDGTAYTVDWDSLRGLTNNRIIGPAQTALVSGVRISVMGNPIRTAAEIREHFPEYPKTEVNPNVVDPRLIRRVDDSWSWAARPPQNPPDCKGK